MRVGGEIIAQGIALFLERRFQVDDGQPGLAQQLYETFVDLLLAGLMIPGPERARGNDQNNGIIMFRYHAVHLDNAALSGPVLPLSKSGGFSGRTAVVV